MLLNLPTLLQKTSTDYEVLRSTILENVIILKKIIEIEDILSKLDKEILTIPNYELLLQPLTVREAVASSEIENIMTTTLEMLQAELNDFNHLTGIQKEVRNYKIALITGFEDLHNNTKISIDSILRIHKELLPNKTGIRKTPGTVIGTRLGEVVYRPPQEESIIKRELERLVNFMNNDMIHPLITIILSHYQYETIHPFYDGNGRSGRIIMSLQLCQHQRLSFPVLFLSDFILDNKRTYYSLFREIQDTGDYSNWIVFHLNGILLQSTETRYKVQEIKKAIQQFQHKIQNLKFSKLGTQSLSNQSIAINYFFGQAFYTQTNLSKTCNISKITAKSYLESMKKAGILETRKAGKELLYFIPEFIRILS